MAATLKTKAVNLALQGGGAHGAFTWGVLDRLLEEPRLLIEGITATSAGAMNAAAVAAGMHGMGHCAAGRASGREVLAEFWRAISESAPPVLKIMNAINGIVQRDGDRFELDFSPAYIAAEWAGRLLSPYDVNPLNINPLRQVIETVIDMKRVRRCAHLKLFVSATNVRTCRIKVFETPEITTDALLASACLPNVFRAVEVGGEYYWDGGYMGNPAIFPLIYGCESRDVVIVHINPILRNEVPHSAREIHNRINEVSFNSSLMREMRVIEFVARLVDEGTIPPTKMKRMLIHAIEAEDVMRDLGVSSKLNPSWEFLVLLRDVGRARAEAWLAENWDALGERDSVDVRAKFL